MINMFLSNNTSSGDINLSNLPCCGWNVGFLTVSMGYLLSQLSSSLMWLECWLLDCIHGLSTESAIQLFDVAGMLAS